MYIPVDPIAFPAISSSYSHHCQVLFGTSIWNNVNVYSSTRCHQSGYTMITLWFGTFVSIQLGISSSQLTFTPSFFRRVGLKHQPVHYSWQHSPFWLVQPHQRDWLKQHFWWLDHHFSWFWYTFYIRKKVDTERSLKNDHPKPSQTRSLSATRSSSARPILATVRGAPVG